MRRPRIGDERGIALTVAVFSVVLIGIFSAVLASAAVQLSDTSTQDRDDKSAFQAAQAGLSSGFHRLNAAGNQGIPNLIDLAEMGLHLQCIGLGPVDALAGASECPRPDAPGVGGEGSAGTGTRYRFTVTPALASADCSAEFTATPQDLVNRLTGTLANVLGNLARVEDGDPDPLFLYRCITSTGETISPGGEVTSRVRLQERVASLYGLVSNIVGTDEVIVDGSVVSRPLGVVLNSGSGVIGTNGKVKIRNGGTVQTDVGHPDPSSNPVEISSGGTHLGEVREHQPKWFLPRVNPGNASAPSTPWSTCLNINLLLVRFTGCEYRDRQLLIRGMNLVGVSTANAVVLKPGIHRYCSVTIEGGLVATTVTMLESRIFIDPDACPSSVPVSQRGKLIIRGPVVFLSLNEAEAYSGFYVKGTPPDGSPGVVIDGAGGLPVQAVKGSFYAPETTIEIRNLAKVIGAFYAKRVEIKGGSLFTAVPVVGDVSVNVLGGVLTSYVRTGWVQCRSTPPDPGDRESC